MSKLAIFVFFVSLINFCHGKPDYMECLIYEGDEVVNGYMFWNPAIPAWFQIPQDDVRVMRRANPPMRPMRPMRNTSPRPREDHSWKRDVWPHF